MESLLHYVWKHRLFPPRLTTTDGQAVEVIDVGRSNGDAGPDFFNAKVRIGDKLWAGNVEIHVRSQDWFAHGHHKDTGYNTVVLHVVQYANSEVQNALGEQIPQCEIQIPERLRQDYEYLRVADSVLPCKAFIGKMPSIHRRDVLERMAVERLERKANDIFALLERFTNSWNDAFYVLLSRNMGFGLNSEPFEQLALATPLAVLRKHTDNLFQIEALLFGQSGLLWDATLVADDYLLQMQKEYAFLQKKYGLMPLPAHVFKKLRVRPTGSPFVRLAQLAVLVQHLSGLFASILEVNDADTLRLKFHVNASEYWQTHYRFGEPSPAKSKFLGDSSLDVILINTVAPTLFAYGIKMQQETYTDRALQMLESLKPEQNSLVRPFQEAGIAVTSAFESQALVQLMREYCEKRKCLFCRVGYRMLKGM